MRLSISKAMYLYMDPALSVPVYAEIVKSRANPCTVGRDGRPHSRSSSFFASLRNSEAMSLLVVNESLFALSEVN